jgi:hypothetical protein
MPRILGLLNPFRRDARRATVRTRRRVNLELTPCLADLERRVLLTTVVVSEQANIYGAGLRTPPDPGGGGGGVLPTPVKLSALGNPKILEFPAVSGMVSGWAAAGHYNGPDGGGAWGGLTNVKAWGGISGIFDNNATMFLVGVFLGPTGQPAKAPPTLNVSNANSAVSFSPVLGQQFFIGDGRTSSNALQAFNVPAGAATLYLGFAERWGFGNQNLPPGFYSDNGGQLTVDVQQLVSPDFLKWDVADGGIDYGFSPTGKITGTVPVDFYWSANQTFDPAGDTLAASSMILPGQSPSSLHIAASSIAAPPKDAQYLLAVLDPNHTVLPAGSSNVLSVAYDPEITVTGKYDGSSDPNTIGRFLSIPGVVTGETFTAKLSDSLAALRPYVSTWVGDQTVLDAHHLTTGLFSSWDGTSYVTNGFDPGTLSGPTTLTTHAFLTGGTELKDVETSLDVQPLPTWISSLGKPAFTFNPVGAGPDGVYSLKGLFDTLSIPASAMTIPTQVSGYPIPFIGGSTLSIAATIAVTVSVDLNPVKAPPSVSGNVGLSASLFGKPEQKDLPSANIKATPTLGLDPETLVPNGTFGVTLTFTYDQDLGGYSIYSKSVTLLDPPGLSVALDVKGDETLNVEGTLALDLGVGDKLAIVPDTTALQMGVTTKITGSVTVGYLIPEGTLKTTLEKWLGVTKLPSLSFTSGVSGSLDIHSKATFTELASPIVQSFGGTLIFDSSPALTFTIGTTQFKASSPRPIEVYKVDNYTFGN